MVRKNKNIDTATVIAGVISIVPAVIISEKNVSRSSYKIELAFVMILIFCIVYALVVLFDRLIERSRLRAGREVKEKTKQRKKRVKHPKNK